jgi:hypothetical protein
VSISNTVMFLEPYDKMFVTEQEAADGLKPNALGRAWCVYEVYHTVALNAPFEVLLLPTEEDRFLEALSLWSGAAQDVFAQVDIRLATSFKEKVRFPSGTPRHPLTLALL